MESQLIEFVLLDEEQGEKRRKKLQLKYPGDARLVSDVAPANKGKHLKCVY